MRILKIRRTSTISQVLAILAAIELLGLTCFQLLLALGLPFGKAAWGGKHKILPPGLRIASLFSAGILVFAALIVLERVELITFINHLGTVKYITWILAAFFTFNTLTNLISSSKWEKCIMSPIAFSLCIFFFLIAATAD